MADDTKPAESTKANRSDIFQQLKKEKAIPDFVPSAVAVSEVAAKPETRSKPVTINRDDSDYRRVLFTIQIDEALVPTLQSVFGKSELDWSYIAEIIKERFVLEEKALLKIAPSDAGKKGGASVRVYLKLPSGFIDEYRREFDPFSIRSDTRLLRTAINLEVNRQLPSIFVKDAP